MLPNVAYSYEPLWAIGPMVLFTLTFIVITFYIVRYKHARTSIGHTAWIGVVAGLIYNTIVMTASIADPYDHSVVRDSQAIFLFYTIYMVFAFIPGLIVFEKISCHQNNKIGKYIVYFGYLWSAMMVIIGLALTIITATLSGEYVGDETATHYSNLLYFMYFSNWGFVAVFLVLFGMYLNVIRGKALSTFIAYAALNLISMIVFAIVSHVKDNFDSFYALTATVYGVFFALFDIPVAISFIITIHYGHLWNLELLNDNKVEITDNENAIGSDEPTRVLNS